MESKQENIILSVNELSKDYQSGERSLRVLNEISFDVNKGEIVAIVGASGSGKTTLLGLCAGLDAASSGSVVLAGKQLDDLSEDKRAYLRNQKVGFIFQSFQLLPTLTALENVMVPLELLREKNPKAMATDLLTKVGLGDRVNHFPSQLSGGEQQRVAVARAFSNSPQIVFADEPTGNLDDETSERVEALIFEMNKALGTTLIIVTHDLDLAARADRQIRLKGGQIVERIDNAIAAN